MARSQDSSQFEYARLGRYEAGSAARIAIMERSTNGLEDCHSAAARRRRARLNIRYRPPCVRLLFIGEAPPASGKFFYKRDSGLYRAIRDAFRVVDESITDAEFLRVFQGAGCYLIDACPSPVDRLDLRSRRAACLASEPLLFRAIGKLQPQVIVTTVRSIRNNVERAASRAGWHGRILDLPYPGRWLHHRTVFIAKLAPELRSLDWTTPGATP